MASGKRASMREGPLAALFRRTDEEESPAPAAETPPAAESPAAPATPPQRASAAPPPATAAGSRDRAPQPPPQQRAPEPQREAPQARAPREERQDREPPPHPRETGYPHPSLGATPGPVEIEEPRLPTPQERLRHAFATDIPDDILQRPADEPYDDPAPELRA